jgi:hypothetical protein
MMMRRACKADGRAAVRIRGALMAVAAVSGIILAAAVSSSARAEPSLNSCVSAALARPKNVRALVIRPGDKAQQEVVASADFATISAECQSVITRQAPNAFFKMQRPRNHKRWVRTEVVEFFSEATHQYRTVDAAGGVGVAWYHPKAPTNHFVYRCTPGKGVTHVRVLITVAVDNAADGSFLKKRSYSSPVKIESGLQPILGRVSGPC